MTDLYELTRALVRRGCPEHPRLSWEATWPDGTEVWVLYDNPKALGSECMPVHPDDARALLVPLVRGWLASLRGHSIYKPQIIVEWYEHDDITHILMTKCKTEWTVDQEGENIHHKQTFYGVDPDTALLMFAEEATRHLEPKTGEKA